MFPNFKDEFYNELFVLWEQIYYTMPTDKGQIGWQRLWNNANIKSDGRCIYYKVWESKNIRFIRDIIGNNGSSLSTKDLENKYTLTCKQLEYEILIHAIPKHGKQYWRITKP